MKQSKVENKNQETITLEIILIILHKIDQQNR